MPYFIKSYNADEHMQVCRTLIQDICMYKKPIIIMIYTRKYRINERL